ncbi:MAG: carbon-nitrogen hydrolase family protein [Eubacterium sp.]|nr:carbon-nitrogen hydrolase family protein [Eubacterium sp.]
MKFKLASLQMNVITDKTRCIDFLEKTLQKPELRDIDILTLPEMFCSPYQSTAFPEYAEPEGGEMWQFMSELAKKYHIYLSAGSMPEKTPSGKLYNTAYVFNREGHQIAKHRKVHLFDVSITGGQVFKESDTLTAGDSITTFETEFCTMGLCVCFDIRFPEMFHSMVWRGCKVVLVPASFNMTTGPAHWELLYRARAVDNQVYMVGTSTARDYASSYISYGNSLVVDPWGRIMAKLDAAEGVNVVTIDTDEVDRIRREMPVL